MAPIFLGTSQICPCSVDSAQVKSGKLVGTPGGAHPATAKHNKPSPPAHDNRKHVVLLATLGITISIWPIALIQQIMSRRRELWGVCSFVSSACTQWIHYFNTTLWHIRWIIIAYCPISTTGNVILLVSSEIKWIKMLWTIRNILLLIGNLSILSWSCRIWQHKQITTGNPKLHLSVGLAGLK